VRSVGYLLSRNLSSYTLYQPRQSMGRKCGHWQNNTKTWWQSNTRGTRALAQSSSLLTTRCRLFRCAIIVYSVRYRTFLVTGYTHGSHRYLRWMILTKQHYAHKTSLSPSPLGHSLTGQFFLTAKIRVAISIRWGKKAIVLESSRMRGVPIILDFSLQVKWHKRDKYESNFIYTRTRTRYSRAARETARASLFVINGTQNLQWCNKC